MGLNSHEVAKPREVSSLQQRKEPRASAEPKLAQHQIRGSNRAGTDNKDEGPPCRVEALRCVGGWNLQSVHGAAGASRASSHGQLWGGFKTCTNTVGSAEQVAPAVWHKELQGSGRATASVQWAQ